ncbi:MAG: methyltransferase [Oscillospiraceae bacterium]|nr:methyltransferase [Oscillospiraceae bacterium]
MGSRRDDFAKTLSHGRPSRLMLDFGGCAQAGMMDLSMKRLLRHLGLPYDEGAAYGWHVDERVQELLDIDVRHVGGELYPLRPAARSISPTEYVCPWGITRKFMGVYWEISETPLKGASYADLDRYDWPDPDSVDPKVVEGYAERARFLHDETDYVIVGASTGFGGFELGCWMCGFDDFLYRMAADKDFVRKFFDITLRYQERCIDLYYGAIGRYIHYTCAGDDFATQNTTFVSPGSFDELIAPYLAERIRLIKRHTDAAFLQHSCGNVRPILPSLIRCGVDIVNPMQPCCADMDPASLRRAFGGEVTFHGGIDTQHALRVGTPDDVRACVRGVIDAMGVDGGYILAASHILQDDIPCENVLAMYREAREYSGRLIAERDAAEAAGRRG